GVLLGQLHGGQGLGVGAVGDAEPLLREVLPEVGKAPVLLPQQVLGGDAHVGERQLGGVGGLQADLLQLAAHRVPGQGGVHDEQLDAVPAVVLAGGGSARADDDPV